MAETGEHSTWRRRRAMQDARGRGHNCRQRPSKHRGEEAAELEKCRNRGEPGQNVLPYATLGGMN